MSSLIGWAHTQNDPWTLWTGNLHWTSPVQSMSIRIHNNPTPDPETWGKNSLCSWAQVDVSILRCHLTIIQYRDSHFKDKMVMRLSYFYKGIPIPGKTVFILKSVPGTCNRCLCTPSVHKISILHILFLTLQWRHNECDGIWNHQPHHCLLNHLFRHRSKKTSKLWVIGLCVGNSLVNSPHKGPVMWKMFSFDDVIMSILHILFLSDKSFSIFLTKSSIHTVVLQKDWLKRIFGEMRSCIV